MEYWEIIKNRNKHKELNNDNSVSYTQFYKRVTLLNRPLPKAIESPKGKPWWSIYRSWKKERIFYNENEMKKEIYEWWKKHVALYPLTRDHVQFKWFIERVEIFWMSIKEAINKKKDGRWNNNNYNQYNFKSNNDLDFTKEVIQRMQLNWSPIITEYERERLSIIKAKNWLPINTSLLKLLSYLKNGNNTLSKSL